MNCRSCGTEIADKAIVCYRCGTPTADLPAVPVRPAERVVRPNWAAMAGRLLLIVLAVWLIPKTPPAWQWEAWAAVVIVILVSLRGLRRRRV